MISELFCILLQYKIIQKNTVVKKDLFSQNLHVQVQLSGLIKAHSGAGIHTAPQDDPPVVVTPPPKISWNTIVA